MDLERHNVGLGRKPAIIVVDVINCFTDPHCVLGSECPDVVAANRELLDIFRLSGKDVTGVFHHSDLSQPAAGQSLPAAPAVLECAGAGFA